MRVASEKGVAAAERMAGAGCAPGKTQMLHEIDRLLAAVVMAVLPVWVKLLPERYSSCAWMGRCGWVAGIVICARNFSGVCRNTYLLN